MTDNVPGALNHEITHVQDRQKLAPPWVITVACRTEWTLVKRVTVRTQTGKTPHYRSWLCTGLLPTAGLAQTLYFTVWCEIHCFTTLGRSVNYVLQSLEQ